MSTNPEESRREKESMDAPQEEFIEKEAVPSRTHRDDPRREPPEHGDQERDAPLFEGGQDE